MDVSFEIDVVMALKIFFVVGLNWKTPRILTDLSFLGG